MILISDNDIDDISGSTNVDITASALYLAAGGHVGSTGSNQAIDTNVDTIDNASFGNVTGEIVIIEQDGVNLGSIRGLSTDNGDIDITTNATAAGDLIATNVIAGGSGNIYLETQ